MPCLHLVDYFWFWGISTLPFFVLCLLIAGFFHSAASLPLSPAVSPKKRKSHPFPTLAHQPLMDSQQSCASHLLVHWCRFYFANPATLPLDLARAHPLPSFCRFLSLACQLLANLFCNQRVPWLPVLSPSKCRFIFDISSWFTFSSTGGCIVWLRKQRLWTCQASSRCRMKLRSPRWWKRKPPGPKPYPKLPLAMPQIQMMSLSLPLASCECTI